MLEQSNQLIAAFSNKDKEVSEIIDELQTLIDQVSSKESEHENSFKKVLSCEYLLVKLRFLVETENINISRILQDPTLSVNLKSIFQKRKEYISSISVRLNVLREDISVLQKLQYTKKFM